MASVLENHIKGWRNESGPSMGVVIIIEGAKEKGVIERSVYEINMIG